MPLNRNFNCFVQKLSHNFIRKKKKIEDRKTTDYDGSTMALVRYQVPVPGIIIPCGSWYGTVPGINTCTQQNVLVVLVVPYNIDNNYNKNRISRKIKATDISCLYLYS